jgi:hypothetical protein
LPFLEDALDRADIPYRAEASSLVYQTAEVRDLLACARALGDPSDQLALVTALRSPLFGCGDDDLFVWKRSGGSFNLTAPVPDSLLTHPVGEAMEWLRRTYYAARWLTPSEVLAKIVADRRILEVAAIGRGRAMRGGGSGSSSIRRARGPRSSTADCARTSPGPPTKVKRHPGLPRRYCRRPTRTPCA